MMIMLTCSECDEEFGAEFPYGDDVRCPFCGVWLTTDSEYSEDSMSAWVTGKSADQSQKEET